MALKLAQSQIWKLGNSYLRIVKLERLSVDYKDMPSPKTQLGTHHTLTKKEFCRLIKDATLVSGDGVTIIDPSQQMPMPLPMAARPPIPVGSRPFRSPPAGGKRGKAPAKGRRGPVPRKRA
jgi:hypothetical protein